jgi:hypothetical protein
MVREIVDETRDKKEFVLLDQERFLPHNNRSPLVTAITPAAATLTSNDVDVFGIRNFSVTDDDAVANKYIGLGFKRSDKIFDDSCLCTRTIIDSFLIITLSTQNGLSSCARI